MLQVSMSFMKSDGIRRMVASVELPSSCFHRDEGGPLIHQLVDEHVRYHQETMRVISREYSVSAVKSQSILFARR